jgi:hypothetical protein
MNVSTDNNPIILENPLGWYLRVHLFFLLTIRQLVPHLILCFLFTITSFPCHAADMVYSVEGRLRYETVVGNIPEVGNTRNDITFAVSVSNCMWAITATATMAKGVTFKQVYDGDVTSSATQFPDNVRNKSTMGNDSTLGVENLDIPDSLPPIGAGQIWLAYASACKFASGNTKLLELTWDVSPEFRRDRYSTPASWKTIPASPFLPSEVDYYFDADSYRQYRQTLSQSSSSPPRDANKSGSKTKWAAYKASSFTNVGTLRLPGTFDFEVYNPESPNQKPQLVYKYHGELVKVYESVPNNAFVHGFGRITYVEDARFVSQSSPSAFIHYATTNKTIPKTNEPQMVAAAIHAKLSQFIGRGDGESPSRQLDTSKRTVLVLVVAGLAIFPLVIILARRGKWKKIQNKQNEQQE